MYFTGPYNKLVYMCMVDLRQYLQTSDKNMCNYDNTSFLILLTTILDLIIIEVCNYFLKSIIYTSLLYGQD